MTTTHPSGVRVPRMVYGAFALLGVVSVATLVWAFAQDGESSRDDASLPNPMGGPVTTAPGEATGTVSLTGLEVDSAELAMGEVPLDVTVAPTWTVRNPTSQAVSFTTGMPQVLEGCCPGPVFADGHEVAPGQTVEVPASGSVELAFPLQMHEGMGGYHHLAVPLASPDGGEVTALHVTGDFLTGATL